MTLETPIEGHYLAPAPPSATPLRTTPLAPTTHAISAPITPSADAAPGAAHAPHSPAQSFVSRRALVTSPATPATTVTRSTVVETWRWLWKDTLGRVVPFVVAAGVYARLSGVGWRGIGLSRSTTRELGRDLAWGVTIGLPLAGLAAVFRARVAPRYRLPTASDQALQTAFYLGINAPAEELFWRGFVQTMIINGVGRLGRRLSRGRHAEAPETPPITEDATKLGDEHASAGAAESIVGWALTTAIFGAYHRLGGWSWRSIAGVTAAGGVFGAVYLVPRKRRTIIPATIIHGLATAAFLSWGDATLHLLSQRRKRA